MPLQKPTAPINFNGIKIEPKEDWEEECLETSRHRIRKTLEILNPEPKNKILEIGCDSGLFSIILKRNEKFKDIEHYAAEVAPERAGMAISRGVNVVIADVEKEKLPFSDNFFDIVLFTEVMEHLSSPLLVLSEIKRVVKPTGTVIISTPNAVGLHARYNHLFGCSPFHPLFLEIKDSKKNKYGFHRFELTISQCRDLLEKKGYKIEKLIFSRSNHQRRGVIVKIIERISLLKPTWSDTMIFKCRVLK